MFYVLCPSLQIRTQLISFLKSKGIIAVFHYLSLHKSPFYEGKHDGRDLPFADTYSDNLLRLPLYYELKVEEVEYISAQIAEFFLIYTP
jgi:dTDP-4-amino-4,6-dideoxygalactose transaminase